MKRSTKKSGLSVQLAFKLWQKGAPLARLYRRAGRTLRGPFKKLAGGEAQFKRLVAARKRQPKRAA